MDTLKKEGLSVCSAAATYGVPKSTLHDHYTGKVHQSHKGPPRYLNDMEEKQLVVFLIGCAQIVSHPVGGNHFEGDIQN